MSDHETSGEPKTKTGSSSITLFDDSYIKGSQVKPLLDDNARLRAELATMHKVVIDALAILIASTREADIQEAISILETAPEPSDETIALIEANEDEQA